MLIHVVLIKLYKVSHEANPKNMYLKTKVSCATMKSYQPLSNNPNGNQSAYQPNTLTRDCIF